MTDPNDPVSPKIQAIRNALARADAVIAQLQGEGQQINRASARQLMVRDFLPEEEKKLGISKGMFREGAGTDFMHGLGDAGTRMVRGVGGLSKAVLGSENSVTKSILGEADQMTQEQEDYWNPEHRPPAQSDGIWNPSWRGAGNLAGEGAIMAGTGSLVTRGLASGALGSIAARVGTKLAKMQGIGQAAGTKAPGIVSAVAGNVASGIPATIPMGAGRAEEEGIGMGQGIAREAMYDVVGTAGLHGISRVLGKALGLGRAKPSVAMKGGGNAAMDVPSFARTTDFNRSIDIPEFAHSEYKAGVPLDRPAEIELSLGPPPRISETGSSRQSAPGSAFESWQSRAGSEANMAPDVAGENPLYGELATKRKLQTRGVYREPVEPELQAEPIERGIDRRAAPEGEYAGPEKRVMEQRAQTPEETERAKRFLRGESVTPDEIQLAKQSDDMTRAANTDDFNADLEGIGGEGADLPVVGGRIQAELPSDRPLRPQGEPQASPALSPETPRAAGVRPKRPKAVKPVPVASEGIPGERLFDPDADIPLLEKDAAGNASHVLRKADNGDLMIAPAKGGGLVEEPPFDQLTARRQGTPRKQASSLKDESPSPEGPRSPPSSKKWTPRKLTAAEEQKLAAELKGKTKKQQRYAIQQKWGQKPPTRTPDIDLTKEASPLMGHPSKVGGPAKDVPDYGRLDAYSKDLQVEAEVATAKYKAERAAGIPDEPPIPPYKSKSGAVEKVRERGVEHRDPKTRLKKWADGIVESARKTVVTYPKLKGSDVIGAGGETRTVKYALTRDQLRQMHSIKRNTTIEAASDMLNALVEVRNADEFDIISHKLFVEHDLEELGRGLQIPYPLDHELLLAERAALEPIFKKHPRLVRSLEKLRGLHKAVANDLVAAGHANKEILEREWYLHNEILDFIRENSPGTSSPRRAGLSTQGPRSLGKKTGSARDYNRDYLDVTTRYFGGIREYMAKYKAVRDITYGTDFRVSPKEEVAHLLKEWDGKAPPPGYTFYNVRNGLTALRGTSLMERTASDLMNMDVAEVAKELRVSATDLANALTELSLGVKGHPLTKDIAVIPSEVAEELTGMLVKEGDFGLWSANVKVGRAWKYGALNFNPIRRISRDAFGDIERWVAQFGLKDLTDGPRWKAAWKRTKNAYVHGKLNERMEVLQKYSVNSSGMIINEVKDVHQLDQLRKLRKFDDNHLFQQGENALNGVKRIINFFPKLAQFREDLLRGYTYDMIYPKAVEWRMRGFTGEAPNTGIVDIAEFRTLIEQGEAMNKALGSHGEDPVARATAMVARRSLGDYGDFTGAENKLRQSLVPFYAFKSINTLFWGRDLPKAVMRGEGSAAGAAAGVASKAMRGLATVVAARAGVRLWNSTIMDEAETNIPEYMRNQFHIILPDPDHLAKTGELRPWYKEDEYGHRVVRTLSPTDALDDFFRITGLQGIAPEFISWMRGEIDHEDMGRYVRDNMIYDTKADSPFPFLPSLQRDIGSSLGPGISAPAAGMGVSAFPDPLRARPIKPEDRTAAVLNALAIGGTPMTSPIMSLSDQSLAPNQTTILDPIKSLGQRDIPVNEEPTRLVDLRRDIGQDIDELQDLITRAGYVKSGVAKRSLSDAERTREFNHMQRIMEAKKKKIEKRLEIFWKLQRYAETAAR